MRKNLATSLLLATATAASFLGAQAAPEVTPNRPGERLTNGAPPPGPRRADRTPRWRRGYRPLTAADREAIARAEDKRLRRQARNLLNRAAGAF